MSFLTIIFKNTIRRPLRSSLTVFAIAIAIGAVVALVGVSSGFERTFMSIYKSAGVDLIVVRAGAKQRLTSTLDQKLGDRIAQLPGVKAVIPGSADVVSFEDFGLYAVLIQGWEPESVAFDHLQMTAGRSLKKSDGKTIILGEVLAKNLDKKVGDQLAVFEGDEFEIVGLYKSKNVFEDGAGVIALSQLQRVMDRPGQVTGFSVLMQNPSDTAATETARAAIEKMASGLTAMTTAHHVESITEIQAAKAMAWLTSAVALLIGVFGIMNTMIMSVHERTKEIGLLRALGWRRKRVIRMVLLESVVLSIIGAAVGSLGAFVLVRLLTQVPAVSGLIDGRIDPIYALYGLGIALVVGFLGGILPAFRASRLLPTEALRYE